MRVAWVGGAVRSRTLLERRLGFEGALELAECQNLEEAIALLAPTAYGRLVKPELDLEEAQRAVLATTLWHLRVLAGWLPPAGAESIRVLAAWYELANIEDRLAYLEGGRAPRPFELGSLSAAWSRAQHARTPSELRSVLATSPWGDPGGQTAPLVHAALRLAWARRTLIHAPEAARWVAGAAALAAAKEFYMGVVRSPDLELSRIPGLGSRWQGTNTLTAFAEGLPEEAAWALEGVAAPGDLWRAELDWWSVVEREALQMVRVDRADRGAVVGSAALLAVDAWRTVRALEIAARGGDPVLVEEFRKVG